MSSDPESELIAQQLKHTVDLLRFEIDNLKTTQAHAKEIFAEHSVASHIRGLNVGPTTTSP